jgi:hypothetical protein
LTEAITALAFNDPVSAQDIVGAVTLSRWGSERRKVHARIVAAAKEICDAGFAGELECWGRKVPVCLDKAERQAVPTAKISRGDYVEYSNYIIIGADDLRPTESGSDEFDSMFSGLAADYFFGDVVIVRAQFEALWPSPPSSSSASKARKGRPPGSGGFMASDETLVGKMRDYIICNPGTTPHYAAGQFADQAAGTGSLEAKQRRLAERYRRAHPN